MVTWTQPVAPAYRGKHRAPRNTSRVRVAHSEVQVLTASCKALLRHYDDGRSKSDATTLARIEAVDMRLAMAVAS